ncbi:radical SAM protein [Syntrophomonas erecta]
MFLTLYANEQDQMFEHPGISMLGRTGSNWVEPEDKEMIPLPKGASLVKVPNHLPVGIGNNDQPAYFSEDPFNPGQKASAVAALLPQGYTRTLLPACVGQDGSELPLLGYAAVGLKGDQVYVAALQSDEHRKWHPVYYNTSGLPSQINRMLNKYPDNRILRQLAQCSLKYSCFTAQNIFYQRWEGGIPTMPVCNAGCIGCISENHTGVDSPQQRLSFKPDIEEIAELGLEHLEHAREAIISFGQGCEGEPSLNSDNLSQAIKIIRSRTPRGTININTNAGFTRGIVQLCDSGLDSMRVTVFSFQEENYLKYHRPRGYSFANVEESIRYAGEKGVQVAINLLIFPGFTDRKDEVEALLKFIDKNPVHMIQMRNLNIDPDTISRIFGNHSKTLGIVNFIHILKQEIPGVKLGSYTHPIRTDE